MRRRIATLEAALREILRINNCSPEQPWCDDPSYSNDDHYCGHWQEINRVAREALEVDDDEPNRDDPDPYMYGGKP